MGAGQQMQQAQAKAGFAGSGAGQSAQQQARGNIMQDFLSQEGAAKSSLFKGIRGERESWAADVASGLSALQGKDGTEEYGEKGTPLQYDEECLKDCQDKRQRCAKNPTYCDQKYRNCISLCE